MKKRKPTKKELEKEHELYLSRLGYTPKRLRKGGKVYQAPKPFTRSGSGVPCSNTICAITYKPKRSGLQQFTVAPAYNKGAYQLITKDNIKDIGRS
tara:strand:- start:164 stop:451 length:288 start_codon:yes stop_codon:yes gene_type:complete